MLSLRHSFEIGGGGGWWMLLYKIPTTLRYDRGMKSYRATS